jgi:hypothetical protein
MFAPSRQALWSLAAVCKSAMPARRNAANGIVMASRKAAPNDASRRVYDQFTALMDHLIKLCHWVPQQRQVGGLRLGPKWLSQNPRPLCEDLVWEG